MVEKKPVSVNAPANKLAKAAVVSARIQLLGIRLVETLAQRSLKDDELPTQMTVEVGTDVNYDEGTRVIRVLVKLSVCGRHSQAKEADSSEPPLKIGATYAVDYRLDSADGLTSENFDAFGELNGVHNC
jgi:hypothetical protein